MNRKKKQTSPVEKAARAVAGPGYDSVLSDILELLSTARRASARTVNAIMTATYWEMGRRIVEYEQSGQERANYAEKLVKRLSCDLMKRFGRGFSARNLSKCRAFYLGWPIVPTLSAQSDSMILSTLSRESQPLYVPQPPTISHLRSVAARFPLPWSHYVRLLSVTNPLAREFYETEALRGGWTVRQLDRQIGSQFYERTALSRNKAAMLRKGGKPHPEDAVSADEEIRDPLVLGCGNPQSKETTGVTHQQASIVTRAIYG
jgi:hypothetical protein